MIRECSSYLGDEGRPGARMDFFLELYRHFYNELPPTGTSW